MGKTIGKLTSSTKNNMIHIIWKILLHNLFYIDHMILLESRIRHPHRQKNHTGHERAMKTKKKKTAKQNQSAVNHLLIST